jgi:hypothetical protein
MQKEQSSLHSKNLGIFDLLDHAWEQYPNGYVIPIGCGSIFVIVGIVILLSYVPHCFRTDVDTTRLCCGGEMPRLWTIWMPLGLISFF